MNEWVKVIAVIVAIVVIGYITYEYWKTVIVIVIIMGTFIAWFNDDLKKKDAKRKDIQKRIDELQDIKNKLTGNENK